MVRDEVFYYSPKESEREKRREKKRRPKMMISGRSVLGLAKMIAERASSVEGSIKRAKKKKRKRK